MMTAAEILDAYARNLIETVAIRRYSGSGTSRTHVDTSARGKAWGYASHELVGLIQQGDQSVLLLVQDLIDNGFTLPVTISDKAVVNGRELAIVNPGYRKAPDGTLIAYELQVRG